MDKSSNSLTRNSFDGEKINRIHMEAVTNDILASRQQQKQSHGSVFENQTDPEPPEEEDKKDDSLIRVVLKCPGLVDYRVKISQETEVSRILAIYINAQNIPAEKKVYLIFDGERLDPDSRLSDHDIADLDLVDVLVK